MNNNDLAKKIIAENIYMTVATSGNEPWVAPIRYTVDDTYTFYFVSKTDTRHVAHILENTSVACAIFDSHQADGTGQGLQMSAQSLQVQPSELVEVVSKIFPNGVEKSLKNLSGESIYRLFKIIPQQVFILDPSDIAADRRIEVKL